MQEYDIRKRLLIIIGVSVFLIAILFLALYVLRPSSGERSEENDETVTTSVVPVRTTAGTGVAPPDVTRVAAPAVTQPPVEDAGELYAVQLASIFTERFLSYSNQNKDSHIDIAVSMATERAARWILSQGQEQNDVYEGVSTRVITTELSAYDGTRATVLIDMKRSYSGAREDSEFSRARVELVKIGPDWKIDGFYLNPEEDNNASEVEDGT